MHLGKRYPFISTPSYRSYIPADICCCCSGEGAEVEDLLIDVRSNPVFDISFSKTSDSCMALDTSLESSDDKFWTNRSRTKQIVFRWWNLGKCTYEYHRLDWEIYLNLLAIHRPWFENSLQLQINRPLTSRFYERREGHFSLAEKAKNRIGCFRMKRRKRKRTKDHIDRRYSHSEEQSCLNQHHDGTRNHSFQYSNNSICLLVH